MKMEGREAHDGAGERRRGGREVEGSSGREKQRGRMWRDREGDRAEGRREPAQNTSLQKFQIRRRGTITAGS